MPTPIIDNWISTITSDWSTSSNWSLGTPTSTTDASINSGTITISSPSFASSLSLGTPYITFGALGNLTISNAINVNGNSAYFNLGSSTVKVPSVALASNGSINVSNLTGGTFNASSISYPTNGSGSFYASGYGEVDIGSVTGGSGNFRANAQSQNSSASSPQTLKIVGDLGFGGNSSINSSYSINGYYSTLELNSTNNTNVNSPISFSSYDKYQTLKLDNPTTYTGSITGFGLTDTIDLVGLKASAVSYNNTTNILTVNTSPTASISYNLKGNLYGDAVSYSSDGNNGTLISFTASNITQTFAEPYSYFSITPLYNGKNGTVSNAFSGWQVKDNVGNLGTTTVGTDVQYLNFTSGSATTKVSLQNLVNQNNDLPNDAIVISENGTSGAVITAGSGADTIYPGPNATINGSSSGVTTVAFTEPQSYFTITPLYKGKNLYNGKNSAFSGWSVKDNVGSQGTDTFNTNVSYLKFSDSSLTLTPPISNLFLTSNSSFLAQSQGMSVYGNGNNNTVRISGTQGVTLDANINTLVLDKSLSQYQFSVTGTTVNILYGSYGSYTVASFSGLNQATKVVFTDGSTSLQLTGINKATLGTAAISSSQTTVSTALTPDNYLNYTQSSTAPVGKLFLGLYSSISVSDSVNLIGGNGYETVTIKGAQNVIMDGNIEETNLGLPLSSLYFSVTGTKITLSSDSAGQSPIVTYTGLNGVEKLVFSDGSSQNLNLIGLGAASLGNTSFGSTPVKITPQITKIPVSSAITLDGSNGLSEFDFSTGNYTATITGFKANDVLNFFSNASISITNSSATDGNITVTASDPVTGNIVKAQLTGINLTQDAAVFNVSSFNSTFGTGSLISSLTTGGTSTQGGTTVAIKGAGTVDASAGNVTITFASGNYTETITGFKATDKLVGFTGDTLSIVNASGTDGNITINMQDAATGNQVVIQLTGIPAAIDSTIFNIASFNAAFGAGSLS